MNVTPPNLQSLSPSIVSVPQVQGNQHLMSMKNSPNKTLAHLPSELLGKIIANLEPADIFRLERTSRSLQQVARDPVFRQEALVSIASRRRLDLSVVADLPREHREGYLQTESRFDQLMRKYYPWPLSLEYEDPGRDTSYRPAQFCRTQQITFLTSRHPKLSIIPFAPTLKAAEVSLCTDHSEFIWQYSFSNNGRWFLFTKKSLLQENFLTIFVFETTKPTVAPRGLHETPEGPLQIDFSPSGNWVAVTDLSNTLRLYNLCRHELRPQYAFSGVNGFLPQFSKDNKKCLVGVGLSYTVFPLGSEAVPYRVPRDQDDDLHWSFCDDSSHLFATGFQRVSIVNLQEKHPEICCINAQLTGWSYVTTNQNVEASQYASHALFRSKRGSYIVYRSISLTAGPHLENEVRGCEGEHISLSPDGKKLARIGSDSNYELRVAIEQFHPISSLPDLAMDLPEPLGSSDRDNPFFVCFWSDDSSTLVVIEGLRGTVSWFDLRVPAPQPKILRGDFNCLPEKFSLSPDGSELVLQHANDPARAWKLRN